MLGKQYLLDSFRHETACIKHLATKLDADRLDYRPTPAQRSTLELLRYLAVTAIGPVRFHLDGTWDFWEAREKELGTLTLSGFAAAMDRQQAEIEAILNASSDHDLATREVKDWFGNTLTLDQAFVGFSLKFLIAYKMQLFLYAKSVGAQISSPNLWRGMDAPPK